MNEAWAAVIAAIAAGVFGIGGAFAGVVKNLLAITRWMMLWPASLVIVSGLIAVLWCCSELGSPRCFGIWRGSDVQVW